MSARPVRLHAERLEDRLMMAADGAPEAELVPSQAADIMVLPTAPDTAPQDPIGSIAATSAPWERFQSAVELEAWLVEAAVAQWGHLFGQPAYYPAWHWSPIFRGDTILLTRFTSGVALDTSSTNHSSTNVQVEGVDEADLVESDGEYLYIISGRDLVIVQAGTGDELRVVSRVALDEQPIGMYLSGDRLTLISSSGNAARLSVPPITIFPFLTDVDADSEQLHTAPRSTTTVTVLDLTDRAAPTLVQKTQMDGHLVASRVVDGQLRLVLSNEIYLPPPIAKETDGTPQVTRRKLTLASPGAIIIQPVQDESFDASDRLASPDAMLAVDYFWPYHSTEHMYETQDEYLTRVRDDMLASVRPQVRSLALDGSVDSEIPLFDATDLHRPESLFDRHITTVATFDLMDDAAGPASTVSILTAGVPQMYSTADSIYVFAEKSAVGAPELAWISDAAGPISNVWKFALDSETHTVELLAKGHFQGTLLNQFSVDEHDGYLRVVTTTGWGIGHSVLVLEQAGEELQVVGNLDGIAPSENLHSVRFIGERAFFVTFRNVDPLFAVDLADPTAPTLLGELHIPGYSDYLQPIDENHLLAIGRGADEATGLFHELQVSIFDVSNMADPQLVHRYSFGGGRSTMTRATGDPWIRGDGDHHSVSYFPSEEIFAMPIFSTADTGWWWNGPDDTPLFEVGHGGLQVFQIDVDAGFVPLGIIEHDAVIERSVQIGENLFAISSGAVSVHELFNPAAELGRISIGGEQQMQTVELAMYQRPMEIVTLAATDTTPAVAAPSIDPWTPSPAPKQARAARAAAFAHFAVARSDTALAQLLATDINRSEKLQVAERFARFADDADSEADQKPQDLSQLRPHFKSAKHKVG